MTDTTTINGILEALADSRPNVAVQIKRGNMTGRRQGYYVMVQAQSIHRGKIYFGASREDFTDAICDSQDAGDAVDKFQDMLEAALERLDNQLAKIGTETRPKQ